MAGGKRRLGGVPRTSGQVGIGHQGMGQSVLF